MKNQTSTTKSIARIVGVTTLVLLVPAIGMQFGDEVDWGAEDFIIAGVLFLSAGFISEFVVMKIQDTRLRIFVGLTVLAVFLLIWAELAVGIFD